MCTFTGANNINMSQAKLSVYECCQLMEAEMCFHPDLQ